MADTGRSERDRRAPLVVVPPLPATLSLQRAADRRRALSAVDGGEVLWREPYGAWEEHGAADRDERPRRMEYGGWSAAEFARRRTQFSSAALLLASRVTDTVLNVLDRRLGFAGQQVRRTVVDDLGYQCLVRRHPRPAGTIGSFVQIECRHPEFLAGLLAEVPQRWLGIETVVVGAEPPRPLGGGLRGEIGGYLQAAWPVWPDANSLVGLTCHHVENFQTVRDYYRTSTDSIETPSPDAQTVIVDGGSAHANVVDAAAGGAVLLAIHHRCALTRAPRPGRAGHVLELVETFPHLGHLNRFPSMRIRSAQRRLFGLLNWPPGATFGRPGDSGSWAVDAAAMAWLGMIVAGRPDLGDTYAHSAEALLHVVQDELNTDNHVLQPRSLVRS